MATVASSGLPHPDASNIQQPLLVRKVSPLLVHSRAPSIPMTLASELARFAVVSSHLQDADASHLVRYSACLSTAMADITQEFLHAHRSVPLMVCFSCDPSSLLVQSTSSSNVGQQPFRRSGKQLLEILLQRACYKCLDVHGKPHLHIEMAIPVPLEHGKAAANLFLSATKLFHLPRTSGHVHILITHICCDRAIHTAMESLLWGRLEAYYKQQAPTDFPEHAELYHLAEWFVSTPCVAHAAQNSLKWAVTPFLHNDALQDLHVGIEACRNSFSMLEGHLFDFLLAKVVFREQEHDLEEARALWSSLGIDASFLDVLSEVHPIWNGRCLLVSAHLEGKDHFLDTISTVIFYLWRWRRFTESSSLQSSSGLPTEWPCPSSADHSQ